MRRYILILFCVWAVSLSAQQFEIQSFRQLQNDITAWVDPVRDLNKEACALIKVTGGRDFSFVTPLGVVKRKEEVGETWVYVPRGTIQMTLKHPRWGVLRDYRFEQPLESRMVYEMVIAVSPEQPLNGTGPVWQAQSAAGGELRTKLVLVEKRPRPKEPLLRIAMLSAEVGASQVIPGIRLGIARRHGMYLHASANFVSASSDWECYDSGMLLDGNETPYYRSTKRRPFYILLAGGLHRLNTRIYVYEGLGYGNRQLIWETNEGVRVKNVDASYRGMAAEAGVLYKWRRFFFSAGVATLKAEVWTLSLGAGLSL